MKTLNLILIGVCVAGSGIILYLYLNNKKEGYGAMKNIKHIPFNDCRRICEGYYDKCVSDFMEADPTFCDRRLKACTAECYYTPYHRLQG
jgi:hypothetical protein